MKTYTAAVSTQDGSLTDANLGFNLSQYNNIAVMMVDWSTSGATCSVSIRPIGNATADTVSGVLVPSAGNSSSTDLGSVYQMIRFTDYPAAEAITWHFSASGDPTAKIYVYAWNTTGSQRI